MGKEKSGFLTPKAIANRIKAKGLQKLRWYCQMCQKQCRDENGFKCHTTSESHQRQLLLFAENPDSYISSFSQEFLDDYMELLSRRFGKKRVHCNVVYQEYISERDHVHMTSTEWETLTDFVKYLGKEGLCVVDDTEKGWFVQYIDRNPEMIKRMEAAAAKEKMNLDDEEKTAKYIQKQIERASESEREKPEAEFTDLQRDDENEKVAFIMGAAKKDATFKLPTTNSFFQASSSKKSMAEDMEPEPSSQKSLKRKSALDEIMEFEEKRKEKQKRKEYWLHKGIVVKVITKKLGDVYYKRKGHIKSVQDHYTALVKMLDTGDTIKLDQAHLETVIPALNKPLIVVNGAYRGEEATLVKINENKFCCSVRISAGPLTGRIVEGIPYEDVSKQHIPDK